MFLLQCSWYTHNTLVLYREVEIPKERVLSSWSKCHLLTQIPLKKANDFTYVALKPFLMCFNWTKDLEQIRIEERRGEWHILKTEYEGSYGPLQLDRQTLIRHLQIFTKTKIWIILRGEMQGDDRGLIGGGVIIIMRTILIIRIIFWLFNFQPKQSRKMSQTKSSE